MYLTTKNQQKKQVTLVIHNTIAFSFSHKYLQL